VSLADTEISDCPFSFKKKLVAENAGFFIQKTSIDITSQSFFTLKLPCSPAAGKLHTTFIY